MPYLPFTLFLSTSQFNNFFPSYLIILDFVRASIHSGSDVANFDSIVWPSHHADIASPQPNCSAHRLQDIRYDPTALHNGSDAEMARRGCLMSSTRHHRNHRLRLLLQQLHSRHKQGRDLRKSFNLNWLASKRLLCLPGSTQSIHFRCIGLEENVKKELQLGGNKLCNEKEQELGGTTKLVKLQKALLPALARRWQTERRKRLLSGIPYCLKRQIGRYRRPSPIVRLPEMLPAPNSALFPRRLAIKHIASNHATPPLLDVGFPS
ncbi:unnamed protein product, partial [Protopolystoma xenopodis]